MVIMNFEFLKDIPTSGTGKKATTISAGDGPYRAICTGVVNEETQDIVQRRKQGTDTIIIH
jgi:hypothetical protein